MFYCLSKKQSFNCNGEEYTFEQEKSNINGIIPYLISGCDKKFLPKNSDDEYLFLLQLKH